MHFININNTTVGTVQTTGLSVKYCAFPLK